MNDWVPALKLIGIGFYIVFCILLGTGAGLWLDGMFETKPWLAITGLVAGLCLAGYGAFRMVRPFLKHHNGGEKSE